MGLPQEWENARFSLPIFAKQPAEICIFLFAQSGKRIARNQDSPVLLLRQEDRERREYGKL
jgi:hypothetical protein